ncbi:MAG: ABC transporter permease [Gammaproteobacteria bacterium]|nr:ABC transporter permease [Gammaproteobacteria bacterium]
MFGRSTDIRIILEEEFRRQVRRTGWRVFTIGVPIVLLIAAFIVPIALDAFSDGDDVGEDQIGYIDNSGITDSLASFPGLIRFDGLDAGTQSLANGDLKALFVIPADYVSTGHVDWYRKSSGLATGDSASDAFRNVLRVAIADETLSPEKVARILEPAEYTVFTVDDEGRPESSGSVQDQIVDAAPAFIFSMFLLISIFVGSAALLQSVAEEKENRMVEMLVTSTTPFSLMVGKVLGLGAAGLLQIVIWIVAAFIAVPRISSQFESLSSLSIEFDLLLLLIAFYLAGYFVFAALMASIGAASTSVREGSQISAVVMIPGVIPIYASSLIIPNPDGVLARVLSFIPLTAPTASMMRLAGGTTATFEIILGLLVTIASGIALMWLSARVFRAGLLLYGQRMTIRSVWRALRQAD